MIRSRFRCKIDRFAYFAIFATSVALSMAIPLICPKAAFAQVLQGRIEQLTGKVETKQLTGQVAAGSVVLQKQTPQLDRRILDGRVDAFYADISYPEYLLGKWGGPIEVVWVDDRKPKPNDIDDIPKEYVKGTVGKVVLEFQKQNQSVVLKPTCVYFPAHDVSYQTFLKQGLRPDGVHPEDAIESKYRVFNAVSLNNLKGYFYNGSISRQKLVANSLKTLRRGVVEQDMVVRAYRDQEFRGYQETVLRFTWYTRNRIYLQVALAFFDKTGVVERRSLIQGWITPNWQKVANELSIDYELPWEKIDTFGVTKTK